MHYYVHHYVLMFYGVRSDYCLNASIHTQPCIIYSCNLLNVEMLKVAFLIPLPMSLDVGEIGWAGQGQNS